MLRQIAIVFSSIALPALAVYPEGAPGSYQPCEQYSCRTGSVESIVSPAWTEVVTCPEGTYYKNGRCK